METRDSNGTLLADGDNVTLIKDLKVKGTSTTLKRGTIVKGIRLTGDPDEREPLKAIAIANHWNSMDLRYTVYSSHNITRSVHSALVCDVCDASPAAH